MHAAACACMVLISLLGTAQLPGQPTWRLFAQYAHSNLLGCNKAAPFKLGRQRPRSNKAHGTPYR